MIRLIVCLGIVAATAVSAPGAAQPQSAGKVKFNCDIRPIMSDTCFHCYGFDAKTRKAGLRLDIREEALKKTDNDVIPIVPGKPEESEIIRRIFSDDKDDIMPPVKAHKEFTEAQKELFRRWVAEGAEYEAHWAYAPLAKPPMPANSAANPIDAFIREKLAEKKIAPSPEAPKVNCLLRSFKAFHGASRIALESSVEEDFRAETLYPSESASSGLCVAQNVVHRLPITPCDPDTDSPPPPLLRSEQADFSLRRSHHQARRECA